MNSTETTQVDGGKIASHAILPGIPQQRKEATSLEVGSGVPAFGSKNTGYGLPCAKCKTYYAADLTACPVCSTKERVSPLLQSIPTHTAAIEEPAPDPEIVEQERERFLQEFQSQIQSGSLQINTSESFRCSKEENHEGATEPATVCHACYEHMRERADQAEAALHMDVKEATQIIYDAVWSDPSDPTKTYQNAAQSLLNEMRKRAGIASIMGPFQTLQH